MHFDDNNFGLTFLACYELDGGALRGGSHCVFSTDWTHGVVVDDSRDGLCIMGDYRRVLHSARSHGLERLFASPRRQFLIR